MKTTNTLLVVLILCVVGHAAFIQHTERVREDQRDERARQRASLMAAADKIYSQERNYVSHRAQEALEGKLPFSTEEQDAMLLRAILERIDARDAAIEKFPL